MQATGVTLGELDSATLGNLSLPTTACVHTPRTLKGQAFHTRDPLYQEDLLCSAPKKETNHLVPSNQNSTTTTRRPYNITRRLNGIGQQDQYAHTPRPNFLHILTPKEITLPFPLTTLHPDPVSGVDGMTMLLKRVYLVLMAKLIKTLEARLLKSTTSFAAKVRKGDTIVFQAGNDAHNVPEQLHFQLHSCPTLYSCASEMLEAVDLARLVPGAGNTDAAMLIYWRIATARWLTLDTTEKTNRADSKAASKLTKAASDLTRREADHRRMGNHDGAPLNQERAALQKQMDAALRLMGVRPSTYKLPAMLATLQKVADAGTKVGQRRDTAATKAQSAADAPLWDKWVRDQEDLQYVVWDGRPTWWHIAGLPTTTPLQQSPTPLTGNTMTNTTPNNNANTATTTHNKPPNHTPSHSSPPHQNPNTTKPNLDMTNQEDGESVASNVSRKSKRSRGIDDGGADQTKKRLTMEDMREAEPAMDEEELRRKLSAMETGSQEDLPAEDE